MALGAIVQQRLLSEFGGSKTNTGAGEPMNRQSQFVGSTTVMFMNDELRAKTSLYRAKLDVG